MSKLDLQIALEISLLLWNDIASNGLQRKQDSKYFYLVKDFASNCSLCELYIRFKCARCCLNSLRLCHCGEKYSAYDNWRTSLEIEKRIVYSTIILDAIKDTYQNESYQIDYEALELKYKKSIYEV